MNPRHLLAILCALFLCLSGPLSAAVSVVTTTVATGDIRETLPFTGEIKPFQESIITSDLSGLVEKVLVESGQTVKAGEPLVILDKARHLLNLRSAELQVSRAEQMIKETKSDYERQKTLFEKRVLNEKAFEMAESAYVNAENSRKEALNAVEQAKLNVSRTVIPAPFSGFFVSRSVFPGQGVSPGIALGRVIDLKKVYIDARIPENSINRLKIGQTCSIQNDEHEGKISFIDLYADSARAFLIRILTDNPDFRLKANMFVKGEMVVTEYKSVPLFPATALVNEAGQSFIFTVRENKAVKREVEILARDSSRVYARGLEPGEAVVTIGQNNLNDGTEIQSAESPSPKSISSTHPSQDASPVISTDTEMLPDSAPK